MYSHYTLAQNKHFCPKGKNGTLTRNISGQRKLKNPVNVVGARGKEHNSIPCWLLARQSKITWPTKPARDREMYSSPTKVLYKEETGWHTENYFVL